MISHLEQPVWGERLTMGRQAVPPRPTSAQPQTRLARGLLRLAHRACDQSQFELARALLSLCERAAQSEPDPHQRKRLTIAVICGYERLWRLRRSV